MDILSVPDANPSLQPKLKDAREMLKYAAIFFLVAALIYLLWGLWSMMTSIFWSFVYLNAVHTVLGIIGGIVRIAFAVVAIILKKKVVEDLIEPIDQGRAEEIDETTMIIYTVLGFIFGLVISGILILLGYMKLDEATTQPHKCPTCGASLRYIAEHDNWYCDNCQDYKMPVNPPRPEQPPPPGPDSRSGSSQNSPPPPPEDKE